MKKKINVVELIEKYNLLKNYDKVPGNQNIKCIEEMIELSHEIFSFDKNKRTDNLESEIADTLITVNAFIMRHDLDIDKINSEIEYKLKRFDDAIKAKDNTLPPVGMFSKMESYYEAIMAGAPITVTVKENERIFTVTRGLVDNEVKFIIVQIIPGAYKDLYKAYDSWSTFVFDVGNLVEYNVDIHGWSYMDGKYGLCGGAQYPYPTFRSSNDGLKTPDAPGSKGPEGY